MKRSLHIIISCLLLLLVAGGVAQENEAYTKVLDKLTSVRHFSDRPVLFLIGFDTSKSMSVEFDRSKKLTQTILSRYAVPGDSVFIFGFADKPTVLEATQTPRSIPTEQPDKVLASINESLLSLPRSGAKGTVFGRAKLFALEKMTEHQDQNIVVLLFSDNNSEIEMGTDERERLGKLEAEEAAGAETIPLYSEGVSPLWLTVYTNNFPVEERLLGPDGESDLANPRLSWAARRVGSQTLEFISPAGNGVEGDQLDVVVQFLGSVDPTSATLTLDGKNTEQTDFENGRATWTLTNLAPGSHMLFAQAVLSDGKIRTAEKQITVAPKSSPTPKSTPTAAPPPPQESPTPQSTPLPMDEEEGSFPFIPLIILVVIAVAVYFLSSKPVKVRIIGPDSEDVFQLTKGKTVRIGGSPRVETDLVFHAEGLKETITAVKCLAFGKAKILPNLSPQSGSVEVETDEGYSVGESGEPLVTSATVIYTDERDRKQVFTLVKEDASGSGAEGAEYFGAGTGEEATDDGGGDWRS